MSLSFFWGHAVGTQTGMVSSPTELINQQGRHTKLANNKRIVVISAVKAKSRVPSSEKWQWHMCGVCACYRQGILIGRCLEPRSEGWGLCWGPVRGARCRVWGWDWAAQIRQNEPRRREGDVDRQTHLVCFKNWRASRAAEVSRGGTGDDGTLSGSTLCKGPWEVMDSDLGHLRGSVS